MVPHLLLLVFIAVPMAALDPLTIFVKGASTAYSIVMGLQSKSSTDNFRSAVMISLNEMQQDISFLPSTMHNILVQNDFEKTIVTKVIGLIQSIHEMTTPGYDRDTHIVDFMEKVEGDYLNVIVKDIESLFMNRSVNLLDSLMDSDVFHRKSTLDNLKNTIDSMVKITIFSHAVKISLLGNSTKMLDAIQRLKISENLSDKVANFTLYDDMEITDEIVQPPTVRHFEGMMTRYADITKQMDNQIAKKLHENSFRKVPRLIRRIMEEVERREIDEDKDMQVAKVTELKKNLDMMYSNDRYFVMAYMPANFLFKMDHDEPNSQKENIAIDERSSILVFRARPKKRESNKIERKEAGKLLDWLTLCRVSAPKRAKFNTSLSVITTYGAQYMLTDLDYIKHYDGYEQKCDVYGGVHPRFAWLLSSYILYG